MGRLPFSLRFCHPWNGEFGSTSWRWACENKRQSLSTCLAHYLSPQMGPVTTRRMLRLVRVDAQSSWHKVQPKVQHPLWPAPHRLHWDLLPGPLRQMSLENNVSFILISKSCSASGRFTQVLFCSGHLAPHIQPFIHLGIYLASVYWEPAMCKVLYIEHEWDLHVFIQRFAYLLTKHFLSTSYV